MNGQIDLSTKFELDHLITTANREKVNYAVGCYTTAKSKGKGWLDIATYIRREFDRKYEISWHCIVGQGYEHCTSSDGLGHKIKFAVEEDDVYLFRHRSNSKPKPSPSRYPDILPLDQEAIETCHMDTEVENHAIDCFRKATELHADDFERAKFIASEFDQEHNGGWNCILGVRGSFAASVQFDNKCYLSTENFGEDNLQVLLFRC